MLPAPTPSNEAERLAALLELAILDTDPEGAFDEIVRYAARVLDMPIALVSLVDEHRQWFKSRTGLDASETPRDISFCGHAVAAERPLVVPDTLSDSRFSDNPLVASDPNIRFYAGYPIHDPAGRPVGTLCVIDRRPRELLEHQLELLELLARQVTAQLALRKRNIELAERTRRLRIFEQFFNSNLDVQCTVDANLCFVDLNPAFEVVVGYTADELRAQRFLAFVHPDDVQLAMQEAMRLHRELGTTVNFEVRFLRKSGGTVLLAWSAVAIDGLLFAVARDVTAYRTQSAALEASRRSLASILDTAPDAIVTLDAEERILTCNRVAERMFGLPADAVRGRPLRQFLELPSDWPEAPDRREGDPVRGPLRLDETVLRREGVAEDPVEIATSSLRVGEVRAFTCVLRDISERRRLARMQSEFVATVSHELRTPLTAIRGSLGLVAGGVMGELPSEAAEYVDLALTNCDRLVRLLNDILNLEKSAAGQLEYHFEVVDLVGQVRAVLVENAGLGEANGISLELVSDTRDGDVLVDRVRLSQVLTNLVANAVKFSPPGAVISVTVSRAGHWLRTCVRDRGPGVPDAFHDRLFQRFAQADSSDSRRKGGTGLGLHIARTLTEAMRGRIGFENATDGGATFWVDLPFVAPIPSGPGARDRELACALVCEDDADAASVLGAIFRSAGMESHIAPTLTRARELLSRFRYRLISVDLTLADGDGRQLIPEIAADARHAGVPVFVVTGAERAPDAEQLGVSGVVQKPLLEVSVGRLAAAALTAVIHSPPRILHVEDDADTRKLVARCLPPRWSIRGAGSLAEARRELAAGRFDVVVLDHRLPDGDGMALRDEVGGAQIVIFSAFDLPGAVVGPVTHALVKSRDSLDALRNALLADIQSSSGERSNA